jgi:hypothetical protein
MWKKCVRYYGMKIVNKLLTKSLISLGKLVAGVGFEPTTFRL